MAENTQKADVSIEIDPQSITRIVAAVKQFRPDMLRELRANLRSAARIIIADSQAVIRAYPSKSNGSMRSQLAGSFSVRIYTNPSIKKQGVAIIAGDRKLPKNKKALVKTMNLDQFTHPVFGNRTAKQKLTESFRQAKAAKKKRAAGGPVRMITQKGMGYFRGPVVRRHESAVEEAVEAALQTALEGLQS